MRKIMIIIFTCFIYVSSLYACTTAIISGKFTVDGRPLLLKHRDTDVLQNKLMFFNDGKYEHIGLINSPDSLGKEIWAGCNSMGFAIMNSASYNLNLKDTTSLKDREGLVMKQALQTCATIGDFEELLRNLPKPLGVEANFGVIDAKGGAAYYETGNFDFKKFDVNDPIIAPFGYIIRTNFSFTGDRKEDYGLIRYQTAEELFNIASMTNNLSVEFLIRNVSRCLKHSLTKKDLTQNLPLNSESPTFVDFRDFIPRYSSSASVIVQGIKSGESPSITTMWTILGFQLCSVALPCWVSGGNLLPLILTADHMGNAPLCDMSLKLKEKCFPLTRGSRRYYINLAVLLNQEQDGILQKLFPLEDLILKEVKQKLSLWRVNGINLNQVHELYHWLDKTILEAYKNSFNL